ncbi:hypothetical protein JOQ06_001382, partial [Pogonophryne albipinna]
MPTVPGSGLEILLMPTCEHASIVTECERSASQFLLEAASHCEAELKTEAEESTHKPENPRTGVHVPFSGRQGSEEVSSGRAPGKNRSSPIVILETLDKHTDAHTPGHTRKDETLLDK